MPWLKRPSTSGKCLRLSPKNNPLFYVNPRQINDADSFIISCNNACFGFLDYGMIFLSVQMTIFTHCGRNVMDLYLIVSCD